MMEYNEIVLEHFNKPHNVGVVEDYNGYGKVGEPSCGDVCEITVRIEKNILEDIKFRVYGCAGAVATSSAATVIARGKDINYALKLTDEDVIEFLGGLPEKKQHCSLLALQALHQAIYDYLFIYQRATTEGLLKKRCDYRVKRNEIFKKLTQDV